MRPAAHSLSFASPKESKQRKGDPAVRVPSLRYGQPAVLAHGVRSSARPEGHPAIRAIAALGLMCAARDACTRECEAERSDGPCRAVQPPVAAPGAGRLRGEHARRSAHASCSDLPQLFERSAPARSEFCGTPRKRPDPGLPRSVSEGVADLGSPFLCLLSFGEAKESECAAGRISRPATSKRRAIHASPASVRAKN